MENHSKNASRIATNTIILYFRMIVMVIVGLFTSRVILDSLGVEDYGIYSLVGGFVTMFNIFRAGLLSATQRFITYDLGRGDAKELSKTFSTTIIIFLFISIIIIILSESVGIWFINNKLVIPHDRLYAAHWVFQFSVLTLVLGIISYPYNALIVAHEKMSAFAYIAIFEVLAKLGVAYLIYIVSFDKLIIYAALLCGVQLIIRFLYAWYCKRHFKESKIIWYIDWEKIKGIFGFTGWAMFGALASIGFTQGLNVLLGMFFSPVVNAARGIAVTVQGFINTLVTNFQTAINPQIIKSYANRNHEYLEKLIFSSAKLSFYLLFFITLPIYLEADMVLYIWLKEVPDYSVVFFRLIIITTMIDAISNSIMTSVEATGNIKKYQMIVGGILLMIVPIAYVVLRLGFPPESVFIVHITVAIIAFCFRLFLGSKIVGFSKFAYIRKVLLPISLVTITASVLPILLWYNLPNTFFRLLLVGSISVFCVAGTIWLFGVDGSEKKLVNDKLEGIKSKFSKHD